MLDPLFRQLTELHGRGRYGEALEAVNDALLTAAEADVPRLTYWQACFLSLAGRGGQALTVLRQGLDAGLWWSPTQLGRDPDLASLRERTEFEEIIAACEQRRQAAQAVARPRLGVYPPDRRGPTNPLLVAFHMRGSGLEATAPHWQPVTRRGVLLAVPQSGQVESPWGYAWDDAAVAEREAQNALTLLRTQHPFDPRAVVLGGASQGAGLALRLSLEGQIPNRGFIAVAGAGPLEPLLPHLESAKARGVRGVFITGEHDGARGHVQAVHAELSGRGLDCRIEVVPGLGHDYPPDFAGRLEGALEFILG